MSKPPREPDPPPPVSELLEDARVAGAVNWREARPHVIRRNARVNAIPVLHANHNQRRRRRTAVQILADFGKRDCPNDVAVSAELMREARQALGWTQPAAAWRLGFESRSPVRISQIERGARHAPRHARLLMVLALEELVRMQKQRGIR